MEGHDHIKNGFLRADQIDLKSLDEQLHRHLNTTPTSATTIRRARSFDKNTNINLNISPINFNNPSYNHQKPHHLHHQQNRHGGVNLENITTSRLRIDTNTNRQRQDWEIDPSKLVIKSVIARGSFGTVHRGLYDGLDVAGMYYLFETNYCVNLCNNLSRFWLLICYVYSKYIDFLSNTLCA